jgi:hypothetical protein
MERLWRPWERTQPGDAMEALEKMAAGITL